MCVFFNMKTAYEMRISDGSSDVCSSDLAALRRVHWWKTRAERERGVPMRVLNRSVYVGPSLYAHFPVIRLELDLGALEAWPTAKLGTAFVDTLIEALPGLAEHGCRSEEHTSELQSLMRTSYAVFCLK